VDVTDGTLFPAGTTRSVEFRARDASGNPGTASTTLTVTDVAPPTVSLTLSPSALFPDLRFHMITATLTATDNCGGPVALKLVSISSNLPTFDLVDIREATFGTDDRVFSLFARRAPGGSRIYKVVYEGRDAAGNVRTVSAKVVVS
jgi:hypothetical protein